MPGSVVPINARRPFAPRRGTAGAVVLAALAVWTFAAGPARAAVSGMACALERTAVHHSEGLDTWSPGYPRPEGVLDAVMIFLSFPDSEPAQDTRELAADHFPATSRFFHRASYGQFRLAPHPVHQWLRMPADSVSYGIQRDWDADRRSRYLRDAVDTSDAVVDFGAYDIVYLVADPDAPGVDSDATKVVNLATPMRADGVGLRRLVTVFENHPPDVNVLSHETGHVLDLPDLYFRPPAGSDSDWDTHVGDWDLMGSQFGLAPDPFAWHKWKLGWLTDNQVTCVSGTDGGWHEISPLGELGGTKLVAVRTGEDTVLAVEVRDARGNDSGLCTEGVLLYRVRSGVASGEGPIDVLDGHPATEACHGSSVYPPLADAPLGVGESYTYHEGGTTVTVAARTGHGSWIVRVTRR